MRICPYCGGQTPPDVAACPVCGRSLQAPPAAPVARRKPGNRRRAMLYVLIPGLLLLGGLVAVVLPAVRQSRESVRRSLCKCNLKQVGLALHNYREEFGCFPPAYVADRAGRPMHSWRVLILPFIDQADLYSKYNFDEPWDGPNNIKLLDEMPRLYKCPSHVSRR